MLQRLPALTSWQWRSPTCHQMSKVSMATHGFMCHAQPTGKGLEMGLPADRCDGLERQYFQPVCPYGNKDRRKSSFSTFCQARFWTERTTAVSERTLAYRSQNLRYHLEQRHFKELWRKYCRLLPQENKDRLPMLAHCGYDTPEVIWIYLFRQTSAVGNLSLPREAGSKSFCDIICIRCVFCYYRLGYCPPLITAFVFNAFSILTLASYCRDLNALK